MIYLNVYFRGEIEDHTEIELVEIAYPNEEDFMSGMVKYTIEPLNGHLRYEIGVYDGVRGFFPNLLLVGGAHGSEKHHIIHRYPLQSCMIAHHFNYGKPKESPEA